ncbi:MAG: GerMN domain-containing protein [Cyanobacteria bacterium J06592_8]
MKDSQPVRTKPVGIVAAVAALLIAVGGGVTWWTLSSRRSGEPEVIAPIPSERSRQTPEPIPVPLPEAEQPQTIPVPTPEAEQPTTAPVPTPEAEQPGTIAEPVETTVEIYQLEEQNGQIAWVPQPIQLEENNSSAVLEVAFEQLLAQQSTEKRFSEIPPNTQILSVQAESDQVYIDLSPDFTQGGGSASMIGRLGQVIYTATSLNPDAKVWISVGGQPLEILGGEGLEVPQPATRKNFEEEFLGSW